MFKVSVTKFNFLLLYLVLILQLSSCMNAASTQIVPSPTPIKIVSSEQITIEGIVADCRHSYGSSVGIPNATVRFEEIETTTDESGYFQISLPSSEKDPYLEISAEGYIPYSERLSNAVNGAFYLIPDDLYRGVYLVLWNKEESNPQNWHRKWEVQTEFVIVRQNASEQQINDLLRLLATDRYRDMTGGRFTSSIPPTIVDTMPPDDEIRGKTVISFAPDIILGGIASSQDERNGVIYTAEVKFNTNEILTSGTFWHEMAHTVTAGGHINEWPSVVSEIDGVIGDLSQTDIEIYNCIYNSPPKRSEPN